MSILNLIQLADRNVDRMAHKVVDLFRVKSIVPLWLSHFVREYGRLSESEVEFNLIFIDFDV